jgi:hypothetical protein
MGSELPPAGRLQMPAKKKAPEGAFRSLHDRRRRGKFQRSD